MVLITITADLEPTLNDQLDQVQRDASALSKLNSWRLPKLIKIK